MRLRERVKAMTVDRNVFWFDLACKKGGVSAEFITRRTLRAVRDIDPIKDYASFKIAIEPYLAKKQYMAHWGVGSESRHYGHLDALYDYAGVEKNPNGKLFPAMEHAVAYGSVRRRSDEDIYRNLCFIYQSEYQNEYIHEKNPLKPVFCVGPYIHYAKSIYSPNEEKQLKEQLGKTLVVFAAHHRETQTIEYSETEFVERVMNYAKENQFDTVLVSVYFCDVDKEIYKDFERHGAKLVSCGFREDPNFLRRLRTLHNLADMVVANNVGTPVGFCKYLEIPYQMFLKQPLTMDEEILYNREINPEHHMECGEKIKYLSSLEYMTEEQKKVYDQLYVYFSGKASDIKTPKEMASIISVCEKIYKLSSGEFEKYNLVVNSLLHEKKDLLTEYEYEQLKKAVK